MRVTSNLTTLSMYGLSNSRPQPWEKPFISAMQAKILKTLLQQLRFFIPGVPPSCKEHAGEGPLFRPRVPARRLPPGGDPRAGKSQHFFPLF